MLKIGVLISGGGTNLQALIDNTLNRSIDAKIELIISNKDSAGLKRGKKAGIESLYIDPKTFNSEKEYNLSLLKHFKNRGIDLVVLAGYLKILSKEFVREYRGRIINIHPSLIPDFCGDGFYGEKVHQAVLYSGVKETGATLHFVDEGVDTGPIILQKKISVEQNDTLSSLQKKVLCLEHEIIVEGVKLFSEGKLDIDQENLDITKEVINGSDSVKRALISVYDKEGIVEFAKQLELLGWEIISTGGSFKLLKEAGIKAIEVYDVTGFPEILDGRVKTLNPMIHGGILYKRENEKHKKTVREMGIDSIDMVVNNLYPFEEMLKKRASQDDMIENIDIGGPSMIRAAAKNYRDVIVVTDVQDYKEIIGRLKMKSMDLNFRRNLAKKAFNYTAYYDSLIAGYFNNLDEDDFPERLTLTFKKKSLLRYGENPHQKAAFYEELHDTKGSLSSSKQLHGKALSFNNINDANGALKILKEFDEPTIVGVKHANPSGIGSSHTIAEAFEKMYACDKESIFGGIIASNREIGLEIAERISEIFIEVVLAPSFSKEAIELLSKKKNIRLIEIENIDKNKYDELDMKKTIGGLLLQERDEMLFKDYKIVSQRAPSKEELEDLLFAFKCVKHINSNGVVIVKDRATLGFGLGEVNRFWASQKAIERSGADVAGSILASDGFFPFKDSIEVLGKAGVKAIIQPGGSIKDEEVIAEADKHGIAMIFTKMRHFKH